MLKITRVERPDSALTFKLEGRLLEPWVAEVRDVCTSRDGRGGGQLCMLRAISNTSYACQASKVFSDMPAFGVSVRGEG